MLFPASTGPGLTVFVYGSGFATGEEVRLEWDYTKTTTPDVQHWFTTATSGVYGQISSSIDIPRDITPKTTYVITAKVKGATVATAPFNIQ